MILALLLPIRAATPSKMDSSPESGGENFGVRPMQTLLMGLAGCSGIDMISILKKQRQDIIDYKMTVQRRTRRRRAALVMEVDQD